MHSKILKLTFGALSALTLVALPVQAGPDSLTETAVKRFFLASVDDRCHRLDAAAAMAVKAGYIQARNASIRAHGNMDALNPYLARAGEVANAIACDAPLSHDADFARGAPDGALLLALCESLRFGPMTRRRLHDAAGLPMATPSGLRQSATSLRLYLYF